jgi:hypothetical protein
MNNANPTKSEDVFIGTGASEYWFPDPVSAQSNAISSAQKSDSTQRKQNPK